MGEAVADIEDVVGMAEKVTPGFLFQRFHCSTFRP